MQDEVLEDRKIETGKKNRTREQLRRTKWGFTEIKNR